MMLQSLLVLLAVAVAPSLQQCLTVNDSASQPHLNDRRALYLGQQNFSLSMLRKISEGKPTTNVFFSPYSTYHALLLAYFGAANATEESLKGTLRIPPTQDKVATMQAYRLDKTLRNITATESYEFRSSNKIYVSDRISLRPCITSLFEEEVQAIDIFSDPEKAKQTINSWVQMETKDQIKDLIPALNRESKMVLVNAAYFKGLWQSEFLPENTRKEVFHISFTERAFVEMMKQKGSFNYLISETLGAHILELPYKGEHISMFILLPPFVKTNGVDEVLKKLNAETMQEFLQDDALSPQSVEVEVPKFTAETSQDITHILEKMGAGDAFTDNADFSGFTGAQDVTFDTVMHKAKIEVDEKGTKAAAATAIFLFRSARPLSPARFVCNHPFVYLIFDRLSQSILFAGVYRTPHN
ncbi:serine protease inhibitor 88Ea [Anabrus simplex]|uniref:serine protease inhibitor 88Ea n=1 Tax=Anabrus simplex TaxID=316456 RepID=UPI0035A35E69